MGGKSKRRRAPGRRGPRANQHERDRDEPAGADELLPALELLARRRAPYDELLKAIVADTLARFPLGESDARGGGRGALVELGAGAGALRGWLPAALADRTVHTDPAPRALARLRRHAPGARVSAARAQALPIADRAAAGVLGLCVFDAIHADGAGADVGAVAESARVLAPGGRFVHILDMATLLDAPFAKLVAGGLVPIPNVFGDPADHAWPLDLLLLRRDWLGGLLELTARAGHPLGREFGALFAPFLAPSDSFDAPLAADRFKAIAASGERRFALSGLIASACQLAVQRGYPTLQPLPFHSGRYLASLLETLFKDSGAFRVELSDIVTRSSWWARAKSASVSAAAPAPAYRSLALGHERVLSELPPRLLDEAARAADPAAGPGATLVEAGAYVFVATRL